MQAAKQLAFSGQGLLHGDRDDETRRMKNAHGRATHRRSVGRAKRCSQQPVQVVRALYVLGVIAATTSRLLISVRLSPCFTRGSCWRPASVVTS